ASENRLGLCRAGPCEFAHQSKTPTRARANYRIISSLAEARDGASSASAVKSPAWRFVMVLAINDTAPDFEAETTEGKIRFHDWIGAEWAVLFSPPQDSSPACTTELGSMAKIKPEFDKRGVKIIGLSVDPGSQHVGWANDIKETQGLAPNYPMIGDVDYKVSKLYGMLPASVSGDPAKRTPAANQTVRTAFVITPHKTIQLIL